MKIKKKREIQSKKKKKGKYGMDGYESETTSLRIRKAQTNYLGFHKEIFYSFFFGSVKKIKEWPSHYIPMQIEPLTKAFHFV